MRAVLGRGSLLAVVAALALALVAAMVVSATAAQAVPKKTKHAFCHGTGERY